MAHKEVATGAALKALLSILDLEPLERNLFRGRSPQDGWQRVYGGQVLGQALEAANRTVDQARTVHSLHGYFMLGGDPKHPIIYEVESTRDGGSFTTRRVNAIQHGRIIFTMSASFHVHEEGFEHQAAMPEVPPPEKLSSLSEVFRELMDQLPAGMQEYWSSERPFDMRPVEASRYASRDIGPPEQNIWIKTNGVLPDEPGLHHCVLAYASDFTLLDTCLIPHGKLLHDRDLQLASLDHALWFHRPFRADDWLLYSQDSPSLQGSRGFARGRLFARDGRLVASATQEGLVRQRPAVELIKKTAKR